MTSIVSALRDAVNPPSLQSTTCSHHPFATKTVFPDFGIPDLDATDASSSSSNSCAEEDEDVSSPPGDVNVIAPDELSTKPDRDVVVFMALAQRMSLQSLVHILQGHVREQQPREWRALVAAASVSSASTATPPKAKRDASTMASSFRTTSAEGCAHDQQSKSPRPKKKAFRFAELRGGMVRQVVHEIEDWKHVRELWWTEQEMLDMRMRAIATVKHYRKYRPGFMAAVETILKLSSPSDPSGSAMSNVVEQAMKQLCEDSCLTRGLETHICLSLSRARSATVQAVLDEQEECRSCKDSVEITMEALRGQSLAYSRASRHFARKLGEADHVEALKATLSSWAPER
jgi:hypothetical protein